MRISFLVPAMRATPRTPLNRGRNDRSVAAFLVTQERPPGRLAHIGRLDAEPLLEAAVARHRGEHAAVVHVARIQNDPPVRREARRFVALAVGQSLNLLALQVHGHQLETPADPRNVREGLAVRADARGYIVVAFEAYAYGLPPAHRHAVDLRAAPPVGGEVDGLTIGGEKGFRVDPPMENVMRLRFVPSAFIRYIWEPPSFVSTAASCLPSGVQAGALFEPL